MDWTALYTYWSHLGNADFSQICRRGKHECCHRCVRDVAVLVLPRGHGWQYAEVMRPPARKEGWSHRRVLRHRCGSGPGLPETKTRNPPDGALLNRRKPLAQPGPSPTHHVTIHDTMAVTFWRPDAQGGWLRTVGTSALPVPGRWNARAPWDGGGIFPEITKPQVK